MIRAYVSDANYGASIAISLVLHGGEPDIPRRILHFTAVGEGEHAAVVPQWHTLQPDEDTEPTLRLGHDEAIALMQALNTRYSGVDDARLLRKDYDEERKRVDGLISVLAEVVRGRAA